MQAVKGAAVDFADRHNVRRGAVRLLAAGMFLCAATSAVWAQSAAATATVASDDASASAVLQNDAVLTGDAPLKSGIPAESSASGEAPAQKAEKLEAREARVVGDEARTRFIMDLSGPAAVSVFMLDAPYRVVVDLPEMHFELPAGTGKQGKGLISAFRYGLISAGKSRIVLDATGPVAVDKAFVLPAEKDQPARVVVDLVRSNREAFVETFSASRERANEAGKAEAAPGPAPNDGKLRIVLDPGHGGIDSGAIAKSGALEKHIVLAFAKQLKEKLDANPRYEVSLTRTGDSFLSLRGRVQLARQNHADLFVSIHADSFSSGDIRGATVYTLSEKASEQMAASIAESENKSDILAGVEVPEDTDEVSDILIELAQRETKNFAVVFARNLIKELKPSVPLFKRPHQQAGFMVLRAPDVPSALVELGYLSNAEDAKQLTSPEWRQKTAVAISRAIDEFFRSRIASMASSGPAGEAVAGP
jgi:N-acetylmuramoyl-L-alanine amidase